MLLNTQPAFSVVQISDTDNTIAFTNQLVYFEDPTTKLTIDDIASISFKSPQNLDNYYGISESSFWFKIELQYNSQIKKYKKMLVALDYPDYPIATLYEQLQDGRFEQLQLGRQKAFDSRPIKHRNPVFPISLKANKIQVYYLKIKRNSGMVVAPISLWTAESFMEKMASESAMHGLFIGALVCLFLYNLFIWISIRDSAYLYFLGCIGSVACWHITDNGFSFQYLWPESPMEFSFQSTFAILAMAFLLSFGRVYIKAARFSATFDRLIVICISFWLFILILPVISSDYQKEVFYLQNITFAIMALTLPFGIGYCIYKGSREAKFYAVAWAGLMITGSVHILLIMDILPLNQVTFNAIQIGVLFESLWLSLALADKMNTANTSIKTQSKKHLSDLNIEVEERTHQLEAAKEATEKANQLMANFLVAASHDLRQPLQTINTHIYSLKALVNSNLRNLNDFHERRTQELTIANHISQSTLSLTQQLDGILDIWKNEASELKAVSHYFSLFSMVESLLNEYRPLASDKNIELRFTSRLEDCQINSDSILFARIFKILIVNSINRSNNGPVELTIFGDSKKVLISIHDSGPEITNENIDRFVSIDNSQKEASTEFGLEQFTLKHLCQLLKLKMGVQSKSNEGNTVYLEIDNANVPFTSVNLQSVG